MEKLGTILGVEIYADMKVTDDESKRTYERILKTIQHAFNMAYPTMREDTSSWHGREDNFID